MWTLSQQDGISSFLLKIQIKYLRRGVGLLKDLNENRNKNYFLNGQLMQSNPAMLIF